MILPALSTVRSSMLPVRFDGALDCLAELVDGLTKEAVRGRQVAVIERSAVSGETCVVFFCAFDCDVFCSAGIPVVELCAETDRTPKQKTRAAIKSGNFLPITSTPQMNNQKVYRRLKLGGNFKGI
jgi:hypothetical protein